MGTRSETPDLAVDELRRRARRRLVGAIVLALTAAVLLPLLLESEPKPLGEDVSIQIPPVDSGKFVNPLTPDKGVAPGKSGDARAKSAPALPTPAPAETPAATEARPARSAAAAPSEPAKAPASEPAKAPAPEPAKAPAPEPARAPAPEPAKAPASEPAPASAAPPASKASAPAPNGESKAEVPAKDSAAGNAAAAKAEAKSAPSAKEASAAGNFVVQVAAFTDRFGAQALVRKLKEQGFPCYSEAATTEKGTVHRVRVGPFPSREAAVEARAKLKAAGYDSMVARTQ